jgi:hypothetical protein
MRRQAFVAVAAIAATTRPTALAFADAESGVDWHKLQWKRSLGEVDTALRSGDALAQGRALLARGNDALQSLAGDVRASALPEKLLAADTLFALRAVAALLEQLDSARGAETRKFPLPLNLLVLRETAAHRAPQTAEAVVEHGSAEDAAADLADARRLWRYASGASSETTPLSICTHDYAHHRSHPRASTKFSRYPLAW